LQKTKELQREYAQEQSTFEAKCVDNVVHWLSRGCSGETFLGRLRTHTAVSLTSPVTSFGLCAEVLPLCPWPKVRWRSNGSPSTSCMSPHRAWVRCYAPVRGSALMIAGGFETRRVALPHPSNSIPLVSIPRPCFCAQPLPLCRHATSSRCVAASITLIYR